MKVTMSLLETSNDQRAVATDGLVMLGLFAGRVETADEGSVRLSTKELNKQVSAAQDLVERYDVWTTCVYDPVFPNRMPPEGKVAMEREHGNGSRPR